MKGYNVYALDAVEGDNLQALKGQKCKTAKVDVTSPESIQKFKESLGVWAYVSKIWELCEAWCREYER